MKDPLIDKIPLKQPWPIFLASAALSLMLAQPLWAVEKNSTPQSEQEATQKTGKKPQTPPTPKSDGQKAIDAVKKEMKKISDNVSESVDRDKKTLKKKLDKLLDKK